MFSVWVKKTNPDNSAGVPEYKCRVELKFQGKSYFAEKTHENLVDTIRQPIQSIMEKINKSRFNQKELRKFKRYELNSIAS